MSLKATPFHYRAVEENRLNAWQTRNGVVLASHYGSAGEEAVAARFGAVMGDLSWYSVYEFSGGAIDAFAGRAFTRDGAVLGPGQAAEILWLNDAGGVRGRGTLIRLTATQFRLISPQEDGDWLGYAAQLFGVEMSRRTDEGILAVIGPTAGKVLREAGVTGLPPASAMVSEIWGGLSVRLSRLWLGYEIFCGRDDALIVWDRLARAGRSFALQPAGQEALDTLFFESGWTGRSFAAAPDGFTSDPKPDALGLADLIDPRHRFNGKAGWLAGREDGVLKGVILDSLPQTVPQPLIADGKEQGRLIAVQPSWAFQSVLGMAVVPPGTPKQVGITGANSLRFVDLPFLPPPSDSMREDATEDAGSGV